MMMAAPVVKSKSLNNIPGYLPVPPIVEARGVGVPGQPAPGETGAGFVFHKGSFVGQAKLEFRASRLLLRTRCVPSDLRAPAAEIES
jgi:hypothetical protein